MTVSRSLPWLIAAAALAGGLGLYFGQRYFAPPPAATISSMQGSPDIGTRAALVYPQPRPMQAFSLDRTDGSTLTLADWHGHWSLVFIGFTHCPDACPQTLSVYRDVEKAWPQDAGPVPVLYFIAVDPERDTPKVLADYAGYFSPAIVAATGTHDRLEAFTRQLGMIYMKTPTTSGDYTVDHSTHLAVIDPEGRMVALFRAPLDAGAIVDDLQALASAPAASTSN
jgi:protein SCO1/2